MGNSGLYWARHAALSHRHAQCFACSYWAGATPCQHCSDAPLHGETGCALFGWRTQNRLFLCPREGKRQPERYMRFLGVYNYSYIPAPMSTTKENFEDLFQYGEINYQLWEVFSIYRENICLNGLHLWRKPKTLLVIVDLTGRSLT